MAGAGTHYDVRTRFELTGRQRQVLDLVARGYTNAQIGDELGITLDGAKWHVSEIISKLGVSSREEAAEYWHAYNRPGARLSRVASGFAGIGLLRWAGVGAATVAGAAVIAVGVAALVTGGDSPAGGGGPDDEGTQTAVASETPGTPTAGAAPTTEVVGFHTGDPVELPEGMVLYYYGGNVPGEGLPTTLLRAYQHGGEVMIDELYAGLPLDQGYPYTTAFDFERGRLAVGLCINGHCDTERALYFSDDGGLSWTLLDPLPRHAGLAGFARDGQLVARYSRAAGSMAGRYVTWPSAAELDGPPPGIGAERTDTWLLDEGVLRDGAGDPVMAAPRDLQFPEWSAFWQGDTGLVLWIPGYGDTVGIGFLTELDAAGSLGRTVHWEGFHIWVVARLDADRVLVRRFIREDDVSAVTQILDFRDGAFHEVTSLRREDDRSADPVGLVHGDYLRVTGSGTCLYVRLEPGLDGEIFHCYPDGVLLRDRGETREVDGMTWYAVTTPAGRDGWASGDFLD